MSSVKRRVAQRASQNRMHFIVSVPAVPGVTRGAMAKYIEEAVRQWAKGGSPTDPMYYAFSTGNRSRVRVRSAEKAIEALRNNSKRSLEAYEALNSLGVKE